MWSFVDGELKWKGMCDNELLIQYWNEETKIQADFSVQWYDLHDGNALAPKLEVFEDSWLALYQCGQDFLKMLSENDSKVLSKEEMKLKLVEIGFVDKTFDKV